MLVSLPMATQTANASHKHTAVSVREYQGTLGNGRVNCCFMSWPTLGLRLVSTLAFSLDSDVLNSCLVNVMAATPSKLTDG